MVNDDFLIFNEIVSQVADSRKSPAAPSKRGSEERSLQRSFFTTF